MTETDSRCWATAAVTVGDNVGDGVFYVVRAEVV
jgi:hypothetical protein